MNKIEFEIIKRDWHSGNVYIPTKYWREIIKKIDVSKPSKIKVSLEIESIQ